MKPIYTDLHIHTSKNPDKLNENYDVAKLIKKVKSFSEDDNYLISLTDHNVINKSAYEKLNSLTENYIIGVELHVRIYEDAGFYHCHAYFNTKQLNHIDKINNILCDLYEDKVVDNNSNIPTLEQIIRAFNDYDIIFVPHGGQSHATFDGAIKEEDNFDNILERSIYYNHFEGFSARSNSGLERTLKYFEKLGISDFVNLITASDNYNVDEYPKSKAKDAEDFIPTWMLSLPTFEGLRLALSESDRLCYSLEKPSSFNNYIESVKLLRDNIEIDIKLSEQLNVIIGSSSSGKTLLLDSIYNKLNNFFPDTSLKAYNHFGVEDIVVKDINKTVPHYINQNYITKVIDEETEEGIEKIDIIKRNFPGDKEVERQANKQLGELKSLILSIVNSSKRLYEIEKELHKIPVLTKITINETIPKNIAKLMMPNQIQKRSIDNPNLNGLKDYKLILENLIKEMNDNPLASNVDEPAKIIIEKINNLSKRQDFESKIRRVLKKHEETINKENESANEKLEKNRRSQEKMLDLITEYLNEYSDFQSSKRQLSDFNFNYKTEKHTASGHELFIENDFKLNNQIIATAFSEFLKKPCRFENLESADPENIRSDCFSERPVVKNYEDYAKKVYNRIETQNKKRYNIITKDGKNFYELSPGWRTAVLLDIILGDKEDHVPILIDQPEDNLANSYINADLIKSIKEAKKRRQIIVVSHNATIPMMADAQTIVLCQNIDGKIVIKSAEMETTIDNIPVLDLIAEITDGGKASIKKRVKKYNLKSYRSDL
ncbi:MAG: ATPase [Candidatus Woesearchaeota archaeon]